MIYYISLSWDWLAIVANHLFAPEGYMGSHGGDPFEGIIGLLVLAVLGVVDDRGLLGEIIHTFLSERGSDEVGDKTPVTISPPPPT